MNQKKKAKYVGWGGALLVHAVVVIFLLLVGFSVPKPAEEGGMPVMLGQVPEAGGKGALVPVEVEPEPTAPAPQPEGVAEESQPLITQESEESVALKPKVEKKKEVKIPAAKPTEKSEAEKVEEARKKAAEEAKRKAAEEERKRKEAEEAARKRVAGAFGKGAQMGGQGNSEGTGKQGSPTGNGQEGATQGVGGYGSFSLDGRSLGPGGLPRPIYNVQDEGKVVVAIVVNPEGVVISTSIHRLTNTVNASLRKAAEEAARKARFNRVEGLNNQTGTITYYFNLK